MTIGLPCTAETDLLPSQWPITVFKEGYYILLKHSTVLFRCDLFLPLIHTQEIRHFPATKFQFASSHVQNLVWFLALEQ